MQLLPFLDVLEVPDISPSGATEWLEKYWTVSVHASVFYLFLILEIQHWMKDKPAYRLRAVLVVWNVALAVFSILGATNLIPSLIDTIRQGGLAHSICRTPMMTDSRVYLWVFLFSISKIAELFDTLFIVLRKAPMQFLHVYHHITVLLHAWYAMSTESMLLHWSSVVNFSIHSIMYSYYAARVYGIQLPNKFAQFITILQITQMAMLVTTGIVSAYMVMNGFECNRVYVIINQTLLTFSYGLLFLNFYYNRYIKGVKKA